MACCIQGLLTFSADPIWMMYAILESYGGRYYKDFYLIDGCFLEYVAATHTIPQLGGNRAIVHILSSISYASLILLMRIYFLA